MVTPNTIVKLYSGIPCDPTYQNVLQWDSVTEQNQFFANQVPVATYTDFQFIDGTRELRIKRQMENCYHINYVAYQNHRYGNKWFYAFVNDMRYLSPESTALILDEDVWASWQFDLTFNKSFVERETVSNDAVGAHTVPENVEKGPYVVTAQKAVNFNYTTITIYATESISEGWSPTYVVGEGPTPTQIPIYNKDYAKTDWQNVVTDLEAFSAKGKADAVISVILRAGTPVSAAFPALTTGYTARNNKLYTFPYVSAVAYAPGQVLQLQYELWPNREFYFSTDGGPNQRWIFMPKNYAGETFGEAYQITIPTTMAIPWISDYYQNWSAQNRAQNIVGIVGGIADIGLGVAEIATAKKPSGAVSGAGTIVSGVKEIGNVIAASAKAQIMPDVMHGSFENTTMNLLNGYPAVNLLCKAIRPEYAKIIDDYFSMYGYKVTRVKDIELHSRNNWNFVKTIGCNVVGDCPSTVLESVKAMFDAGVTLWHNGTFNYGTLANPIITTS